MPFYLMIAVFLIISLFEWRYISFRTKHRFALLIVGAVYIALAFLAFALIPSPLSLLFLLSVWVSDIGAYLFGKKIQGPRLVPRLSPRKTWAGFIGAVLSPMALFAGFFSTFYSLDGDVLNWSVKWSESLNVQCFQYFDGIFLFVIFGGVFGAVCQAGDILISSAKRIAKVKDSGQIIPGHGGVLDRIDATLLAAPLFLLFVQVLGVMC